MRQGGDLGLDCAVTIPLIAIYGALLACVAYSPYHGQVAVPIYIIVANIITFVLYYKDWRMGTGPWGVTEAMFYIFLGTGGSPGYFVSRCFSSTQKGDKMADFVTAAFLMSLSSIALFAGVIIVVGVLHITKDEKAALIAMGVYFVLINILGTIIICLDAFKQNNSEMPLFAILNFMAVGALVAGPIGICLMGMRRYREKREFFCFSVFWAVCFIVWVVLGFYGLSQYQNMQHNKTDTTLGPSPTTSSTTKSTTSNTTVSTSITSTKPTTTATTSNTTMTSTTSNTTMSATTSNTTLTSTTTVTTASTTVPSVNTTTTSATTASLNTTLTVTSTTANNSTTSDNATSTTTTKSG